MVRKKIMETPFMLLEIQKSKAKGAAFHTTTHLTVRHHFEVVDKKDAEFICFCYACFPAQKSFLFSSLVKKIRI